MKKSLAVFVAGGTGGHINSALALGEDFAKRGFEILFISGQRTLDYQLFREFKSGEGVIHFSSGPLRGRNFLGILKSLQINVKVLGQAYSLFKRRRPGVVLGTGGHVCGPTLLAAFLLGIPVFILEQNSVMGLTNKLLLIFCKKIFVNFHQTKGVPSPFRDKMIISGNPVRSSIVKKFTQCMKKKGEHENFHLVVFGGSLGANSINQLIWDFVLTNSQQKIHIRHQIGTGARPREASDFDQALRGHIIYEGQDYFHEIEKDYAWCDLIICRAGASTISELRLVAKPVILIPYPFHRDRHQYFNAERLKEEALFPVYIHTTEELRSDNFAVLIEILANVWASKKNGLIEGREEVEVLNNLNDPVHIIYQEIQKYV